MKAFNHQIISTSKGEHLDIAHEELISGKGLAIPITQFELDAATAQHQVFELAANYWRHFEEAEQLVQHQMDLEFTNERLHIFFADAHNAQKLFQYLIFHREITLGSLIHILFDKTVELTDNVLERILLIEVDGRFIVQPIFVAQAEADQATFAMKAEAILTHYPLRKISEPAQLLITFKTALAANNTQNRVAKVIHQLVEYLDAHNPQSFALKQMHIFNVLTHFTSGRRHFKKLRKLITQVQSDWQHDEWALTEKEKTLLAYILMSEAYARRDHAETIIYGDYLFKNNQINNHAVEILVEYNHFLSSHKPQMNSLIKDYAANYLEYGFYMMINTLTRTQQFTYAYELLCEYEAASSTAIYSVLNVRTKMSQDYEVVEMAAKQDIAQISQDTGETWDIHSFSPKSKAYLVVKRSSKYITNLAKIMFVMGEYDLYETLKKICFTYIPITAHLQQLVEFEESFEPRAEWQLPRVDEE